MNRGLVARRWIISLSCARGKKGGGGVGKEEFARGGGGVIAGNYCSACEGRARQRVQETRDIKIAKPLCLCKNAKFGPSNAKFAKMHKSNA